MYCYINKRKGIKYNESNIDVIYTHNSDSKSMTWNHVLDNIIATNISGSIKLGNSNASAGSTQTLKLSIVESDTGTTTVIYTQTKSRGSGGSCTYSINIPIDNKKISKLIIYFSATDNEKEKNINLDITYKSIENA